MESRQTAARKITPGDPNAPQTPASFGAQFVEDVGVETSWQGVADLEGDLGGYRVYRGQGPTPPPSGMTSVAGDLPGGTATYTDTTTLPGNIYTYEVRTFDTAGNESAGSQRATAEISGEPPPGGGSGGCQGENCPPPIEGRLILPSCGASGPDGAPGTLCLPGEHLDLLADHTGEESDWRIVFYHTDHLGTPRVLTDELGEVVSRHAFYPFGEEIPGPSPAAASTNSHWFTGHERDEEVGGDYLLARYVPYHLSRFSSPDPSDRQVSLRRASSWNKYPYVEGAPLTFTDPDGLGRLVVRGMHCGGPFYLPLIPHPVFVFDNGRTRQFGPETGVGADIAPRASEYYVTALENLDDALLEAAMREVELRLGPYHPRTNNCIAYALDVMEAYARFLLEQCRQGDVDSCRALQRLCESQYEPEMTCREYRAAKEGGQLPAHRAAGLMPLRPTR
jgi:RHS repeat-associated protein